MSIKYNWELIQKYYNDEHSISECVKKFGMTEPTFYSAKRRGLFVPRTRKEGTKLHHNFKCKIWIKTCSMCNGLFVAAWQKNNLQRTTCGSKECSTFNGGRFNTCLETYTKKEKAIKMIESKEYMKLCEGAARRWIKIYLIETTGHKCSICKNTHWMNHPIPLICDHIDGKSTNNDITNFRLVCGNCELLLPTHGSKNIGNGRKYEREYKQKKKQTALII